MSISHLDCTDQYINWGSSPWIWLWIKFVYSKQPNIVTLQKIAMTQILFLFKFPTKLCKSSIGSNFHSHVYTYLHAFTASQSTFVYQTFWLIMHCQMIFMFPWRHYKTTISYYCKALLKLISYINSPYWNFFEFFLLKMF